MTVSHRDSGGNPTDYSKTTTNTYFENEDVGYVTNWLLGRVKASTVTSTTP